MHRAITLLGYSPNHAARTLAGSRANAIALVISEQGSRVLADPFFAGVLRGVHAELAGRHIQLLLMMNQPLDGEDQIAYLTGGHVDGALVVSLHGEDPLPRTLHETGLPDRGRRPSAGGRAVPFVDSDNFTGALEAVRHLDLVGPQEDRHDRRPADMAVGHGPAERLAVRAMSRLAVDLVVHSDFTPESGAARWRSCCAGRPELDAVFVAADIMAVGALRVLHAAGRRVPVDVAVVGFDDSVLPRRVPPLTTVRQDVERFGRTLTWRLLAELDGEEKLPQSILLPTSLVRRASA